MTETIVKLLHGQSTITRSGWKKNAYELKHLPHLKPFVPNASFFYPLKTSEKLSVFWCFQG